VRADTPHPSTSSEATTVLREEEEEEETRMLPQPLVETVEGDDRIPEHNADLLYLASDQGMDRWLSQVIKQEENKD